MTLAEAKETLKTSIEDIKVLCEFLDEESETEEAAVVSLQCLNQKLADILASYGHPDYE